MSSVTHLADARRHRRRVATAVPLTRPVPTDRSGAVSIDSLRRRDALAVATWIVEHQPTKASPLRLATLTEVERNWIALEALGADHRPLDWVAVIDAVRSLAAVPTTTGQLVPIA